MSTRDWVSLGAGALLLLVGVAILVRCFAVYKRLLVSARSGQGKVWSEPLGLPDLMVGLVLMTWLGSAAVQGFLRSTPSVPVTDQGLLESGALFGALVGAVMLFLQARRIPVARLFGLRPRSLLEVLKKGAVFFAAALPLVFLCFGMVQAVVRPEVELQEIAKYFLDAVARSDWHRVLLAAGMTALVAPLTEEFLFRGYFYGVLRRYLGVVPALLFTSALFAAIHMNGPVFFPLFILAICLTLAYEATGSLLVPMTMHALFNSGMLAGMFYTAHHS